MGRTGRNRRAFRRAVLPAASVALGMMLGALWWRSYHAWGVFGHVRERVVADAIVTDTWACYPDRGVLYAFFDHRVVTNPRHVPAARQRLPASRSEFGYNDVEPSCHRPDWDDRGVWEFVRAYAGGYERPHWPWDRWTVLELRLAYRNLVLLCVPLPAAWAVGVVRRRRRAGGGRCVACGYDLRASAGRCPECGQAA